MVSQAVAFGRQRLRFVRAELPCEEEVTEAGTEEDDATGWEDVGESDMES